MSEERRDPSVPAPARRGAGADSVLGAARGLLGWWVRHGREATIRRRLTPEMARDLEQHMAILRRAVDGES